MGELKASHQPTIQVDECIELIDGVDVAFVDLTALVKGIRALLADDQPDAAKTLAGLAFNCSSRGREFLRAVRSELEEGRHA